MLDATRAEHSGTLEMAALSDVTSGSSASAHPGTLREGRSLAGRRVMGGSTPSDYSNTALRNVFPPSP